jgi:hypothetical protein
MKTGVHMRLRSGSLVPLEYASLMKTWENALSFDRSDIAKYRLHVLKFWEVHGRAATEAAFGIKTSTLYLWRAKLSTSQGRLISLVPKSTRPEHTRNMVVDPRLLEFIKSIREEYGNVGKTALYPLVSAYAQSLGINNYCQSKIGKIIKRNRFFFEGRKVVKKRISRANRVKRSPKVLSPGYIEIDCITVYVEGRKKYFVTGVDVYTRLASAKLIPHLNSRETRDFLKDWQKQLEYPVHTVQTDNGSEFLADFHSYLEGVQIIHNFTYPHSPKVNGFIERFNWTIQNHYVNRCTELWSDQEERAQIKLAKFLYWYNEVRPHQSLNNQTPASFTNQYFSNMYAT